MGIGRHGERGWGGGQALKGLAGREAGRLGGMEVGRLGVEGGRDGEWEGWIGTDGGGENGGGGR